MGQVPPRGSYNKKHSPPHHNIHGSKLIRKNTLAPLAVPSPPPPRTKKEKYHAVWHIQK